MHAMEVRGDRRAQWAWASTALLFVFSLLGLATHDAGAAAAEQVSAAAQATTRTGTAAIEFRFAMRVRTFDSSATGTGVIDFTAGRASLTLVIPGGRPVDLVVDGDTMYQRNPDLPAAPGAKPWVTTTISPMGGSSSTLTGNGSDPLATLRMLEDEALLRNVRHEGSDEVGGVRAAKYTAAFDADKLRDRLGEARPELADLAQAVRFDDATLAVWVSDDGLLRRVETTMVMKVGDQSYEMSSSVDLRDYGAPVRIDVPPADQVARTAG